VYNEDNTLDQYDLEVLHNVMDCGDRPDCDGVVNLRPGWNPPAPALGTVADNVVIGLVGASVPARTSAGSNVTDRLVGLTRHPLGAPPAAGIWSQRSGETARDPLFADPSADWNYLPGSPELGAGSFPPGSPVGVRFRVFDASLFPAFLRQVMIVPPDTTNQDLADSDRDGVFDGEDNCGAVPNTPQRESDGDGVGDACDVCPLDLDFGQFDADGDGQGDACDLDDGALFLRVPDAGNVAWQQEAGQATFHLYRGDLQVLRSQGVYTQSPGSNPLAEQRCGIAASSTADPTIPDLNRTAFYLVTGSGPPETSLGQDSSGSERLNSNPCP
jgi:hypothetical protein